MSRIVITATANATVNEALPDADTSEAAVLTLEQIVTNDGAKRIYLEFPITTIRSAWKTRAFITLDAVTVVVGTVNITGKRTTSAWSGTQTWNTKPTVAVGSWQTTANLPTGAGLWTMDVSALLRDALTAASTTLGIELSLTSEGAAGIVLATFDSIAATAPKLTVDYDMATIQKNLRRLGRAT